LKPPTDALVELAHPLMTTLFNHESSCSRAIMMS
jgi:hypothetical protein